MKALQKYFDKFHDDIRLDDENDDLRSSRDAIKKRLKSNFDEYFKHLGIPIPVFFDQGSYVLGTGVKPYDGDITYDIDEGVKFDIFSTNYSDPVEIKKLVRDALDGHTDLGVDIKNPCVRVIYSENKKEKYHVDLAIYATNGQSQKGAILHLARGKEYSDSDNRYWENSQPEALIDLIKNRYNEKTLKSQFLRIIKFFKRWKDVHFVHSGNSAPRGIALTIATYLWFSPSIEVDGTPDDLSALISLNTSILKNVRYVQYDNEYVERLVCNLPVAPFNDLFGKMTNIQMTRFLEQITAFQQQLIQVQREESEENAALLLAQIFGDDFPSPDLNKAFEIQRKPNIGYYPPVEEIRGYSTARITMDIKGFVFVGGNWVPLASNKKILGNKKRLKFQVTPRLKDVEIYWRVQNTGEHVVKQAQTNSNILETFRGKLEKAKVIKIVNSKYKRTASTDPFINEELTAFTGRHWIECVAMKNGSCVGRSKKFYVNIYNPEFNTYD